MPIAFVGVVYLAVALALSGTGGKAEEPQEAQSEEPPSIQAGPEIIVLDQPVEPVVEPEPEPPKEKTVDELIHEYFGDRYEKAKKVATCESGLRPDAVGDKTLTFVRDGITYGASYGVFQIRYLPGRPTPDQLLNAEFNVKYAAEMQKNQSWRPWTCARKLGIR